MPSMTVSMLNRLGLSPPNLPEHKVKRVLDLGTGTGIWVMDFGDEHPEAKPSSVPPNVQFLIDDIDDDWHYSEPFDYIHSRMMNFSVANWADYLRKGFENLAPGGYMEVQEIDAFHVSDDGTLAKDHALSRWSDHLRDAAGKLDRPYEKTGNLKGFMAEVGFTDINETLFRWPINTWPKDKKFKELGAWHNENTASFLEAGTLAPLTRGLGWSVDEVRTFLSEVRKDLNNPKIHAYSPIRVVYGRKPEP
ncbi:methyltransferase [Fusarium albosuccineum]|uniref:Methyltransferase n=1 Tax=Fusarium albosuccineum TaxID=1237068 RepID=A0A8H4L8U0_9HYPO|nr:methyltransferase [Fusarium albosuccineum]KAF4990530.1 hypothetical protein FDECE_14339 [Fusarium decemcellulare]